jgi:hypothetical protein
MRWSAAEGFLAFDRNVGQKVFRELTDGQADVEIHAVGFPCDNL